ncbi:cyclase family protein [Pectobacterium carotovorum]|nr:cyclase family protein [Pectobacterium carotovorum]
MTHIDISYCGRLHRIEHHQPVRLSSRIHLNDNPINIYGIAPASGEPLHYGSCVASVSEGGSCNATSINLVPHCHGTHTECIGHILEGEYHVAELLFEPFMAATLIRVPLQFIENVKDGYNASAQKKDLVITRAAIDDALALMTSDYLQALVISTSVPDWLPEGESAPYFTHQAMERIVALGVRHLLVDIPSIDRLHDGGRMDNHRIFWGVSYGTIMEPARVDCSVTEMIQVPQELPSGHYFLSIHLPDISGDALPSMPVLFSFSRSKDAK